MNTLETSNPTWLNLNAYDFLSNVNCMNVNCNLIYVNLQAELGLGFESLFFPIITAGVPSDWLLNKLPRKKLSAKAYLGPYEKSINFRIFENYSTAKGFGFRITIESDPIRYWHQCKPSYLWSQSDIKRYRWTELKRERVISLRGLMLSMLPDCRQNMARA